MMKGNIDRAALAALFPSLPERTNKGDMGRLLVVCGSYDPCGVAMCGAAYFSAAAAYIYETRLFKRENTSCKRPKLALGILCMIALLFVIFTFATPEIGIFKDPLTGGYGI